MSFLKRIDGVGEDSGEITPELDEALRDYRQSVHAWSESVYSRPRTVQTASPRRMVWRLVAGSALSCVLVAGLSGGVYEHHRQQIKTAQARVVEHDRQVVAQRAQQEELLAKADSELARVDSEISRTVPSAMEPLAQLMAGE